MRSLLLSLAFCSACLAQVPIIVEVVPGGCYYHRPGHLLIEHDTVSVTVARAQGYDPCLECEPQKPSLTTYYLAVLRDRVAPMGDGVIIGETLSLEGLAKLRAKYRDDRPLVSNTVNQQNPHGPNN